jgi:hypothetical protein
MTTQPTHSESLEEIKTGLMKCVSVDLTHIEPNESTFYISELQYFIDHYTTTKINEVLDAVEELCQEAEGVNLEHNGRPDCKNCSLLENLEDKLSQIKNTHKPKSESEESL